MAILHTALQLQTEATETETKQVDGKQLPSARGTYGSRHEATGGQARSDDLDHPWKPIKLSAKLAAKISPELFMSLP